MNLIRRVERVCDRLRRMCRKPVIANISVLAPNELLEGRTALITGGTSGIGLAIAKAFLQSGANVIITGRNEERLANAQAELQALGCKGMVFPYRMDITEVSHLKEHLNCILSTFMVGGAIDILVNNAGVLGGSMPNAKEDVYDKVMETNLKGTFFMSQQMGKYMKDNGIKGNILNIASSSSLRPAISAYMVSKWGIRGLTLGLAKAMAGHGITVNGIAPGPTATPMLIKNATEDISNPTSPTGRYALPEEIANMAVLLVSDMGRMIVGDIVYMTGGTGLICLDDMNYNIF
ncbi:MAG: SDR family oxidoreductase [Prevotellaceae bacterium]|nr:SDR family oxidoreductase [Prevotellaceae bacterium]